MVPKDKHIITEDGKILNRFTRLKVYRNLTITFTCGSFLNFVAQYFNNQVSLKSSLLFSGCLLFFGILIQIIRLLRIDEDQKENVITFILMTTIPIITLRFIEFASITVWTVSFIFIVLSVVYNRRRMIIWLSIIILLTQIGVWILVPSATVPVDGADHLARIGILSLTLWLAFFVNRIYIKRLEENEEQIRLQKMISQISTDFVNASVSNIEDKIHGILKLIGEYSQVDRVYLFVLGKGGEV